MGRQNNSSTNGRGSNNVRGTNNRPGTPSAQQPSLLSTPPKSTPANNESASKMLPTPISRGTSQSDADRTAREGAVSAPAGGPDLKPIEDLLGCMKSTLSVLGATFDSLSAQTVKVTELVPTIGALHQIEGVRAQFDEQKKVQEERMQAVKEQIADEMKNLVRTRLKDQVGVIVRAVVKREVASRVQKQLQLHIPGTLKEELEEYKRHVIEVKRSLHNAEAKRHNALIRSASLDEPLHPLLRPLEQVQGSRPAYDLEPPTASRSFPRDIEMLIKSPHNVVKELLRDYGLVEPTKRKGETQHGSREEDINRFMSFIGVGFQLVPSSPTQGGQWQPQSPLLTRVQYPQ
ncbi:uncharacterized protein FIBRA_02185 [Fibroporia radiculosa]|uniref:Uncharacterized protein n=1 Tax=Fibroporia radiculosa TaxID=599839 RepID=J4HUH8_9APHY|nr:uncharacterized protein FIBRA_02185 [Fibroporia radiculosa]CCM00157.1 predicted protein [Fibroporia radiculosa]